MPLPLVIDHDCGTPAYRQIQNEIVRLIHSGVLAPGDRLPSTRILGPDLGVHRSTVVRAYEELQALGYVESGSGTHTRVRSRYSFPLGDASGSDSIGPAGVIAGAPAIDWEGLDPRLTSAKRQSGIDPKPSASSHLPHVEFDRLTADPSLAPDVLRRCLKAVLAQGRGAVLDYSHPGGSPPLRKLVAERMRRHGVDVAPANIVITAGAQHALDLLLRYLVRAGDRVVVEAPTYGLMHALLRLHKVRVVEIPVLSSGIDLGALESVLREAGAALPRLIYSMPGFQNPTGVTTDQIHRERLLALCEKHGVPLVEDGFQEEMKYEGLAVMPVKSMDAAGVVMYVGTFSKVVFPGLRVGWIAAPETAASHLVDILHASALSVNTLAQATALHFCRTGAFDKHLRRAHRVYRGRMRTLLRELHRQMPETVAWTRPRGGYTTWLTLADTGVSETELLSRLEAGGVRVSGGSRFFLAPPAKQHLRLSIACTNEEAIARGCQTLGEVLKKVGGGSH